MRADAQRNLDRILRAARQCFADGGLEVGVAEIARRADVGTATVFRRFPCKEDLVVAVVEDRLAEMLRLVREASAGEDPVAGLRGFMERAVTLQAADRGLFEGLGRRCAGDPRLRDRRAALMEALGDLLGRAQSAGGIRGDVAASDVLVLVHSIAHVAHLIDETLPGTWRRYLAVVLDGLGPDGGPLPVPAPEPDELVAAVRRPSG